MNDGGSWWTGLNARQKTEVQRDCELWASLPVLLRDYYKLKAGYYEMSSAWLRWLVFAAVILVGIMAFAMEMDPIFSVLLIIVGVILGVIVVWEIERRK
jgi:hypothetical protein